MAFSLGGVCVAEVGGCAALEAASVFTLGVAFHWPDSAKTASASVCLHVYIYIYTQ